MLKKNQNGSTKAALPIILAVPIIFGCAGVFLVFILIAAVFGSVNSGQTTTTTDESTDDTVLEGNENAEKAFNFFVSKGLTDFQAAGIVGNFIAESNVRPEAVNSIGCTGIAQWCFGRKNKLKALPDYKTLEVQLNFAWDEMTGPYKTRVLDRLKATTNSDDATEVIMRYYEVPYTQNQPEYQPELEKRQKFARSVLAKYGGGS